MIQIAIEGLHYGPRDGPMLVSDISLSAAPGEILGVLGPNGAGKSSLLRCLYGAARPTRGHIRIGTKDARTLSDRQRARLIAAVPQDSPAEFNLTVRNVVEAGRTPHTRGLIGGDPNGARAVASALARLELEPMAQRRFATLSGGERKRALIARALAQEPRVLVLDEPVNHLDIRHQLELMTLIRSLDATVVMALHDFDLAARFCDRLAVLSAGRLVAEGAPDAVLTAELIREVFEVAAHIDRGTGGTLRFLTFPLGEHHASTGIGKTVP